MRRRSVGGVGSTLPQRPSPDPPAPELPARHAGHNPGSPAARLLLGRRAARCQTRALGDNLHCDLRWCTVLQISRIAKQQGPEQVEWISAASKALLQMARWTQCAPSCITATSQQPGDTVPRLYSPSPPHPHLALSARRPFRPPGATQTPVPPGCTAAAASVWRRCREWL